MNFELSEDQKLLQEMIRGFAQKEILPHVKHLEENHIFPSELLKKLGEIGVLGMAIPSEYGGIKTDSLSTALVIEEISRVFPSLAVIISVHCSLFSNSILQFGNEDQKQQYLPRAASGDIVGAFSLTEPGTGSDATNLKTKARREGEKYILNGTKSVGLSQRAIDEAVKYAKEREAFGKKISDFQAIQFMIADMATWTNAARLLTHKAANLCDNSKPYGKESAMAKLFASEAANRIAYLALQIHGGYGYSKEFFVEQIYRDARVLAIYEGTSEVQRIVIARHLLKER
jgi:alkylation response protein AidB-like acyl-CoA dehydrogenase